MRVPKTRDPNPIPRSPPGGKDDNEGGGEKWMVRKKEDKGFSISMGKKGEAGSQATRKESPALNRSNQEVVENSSQTIESPSKPRTGMWEGEGGSAWLSLNGEARGKSDAPFGTLGKDAWEGVGRRHPAPVTHDLRGDLQGSASRLRCPRLCACVWLCSGRSGLQCTGAPRRRPAP